MSKLTAANCLFLARVKAVFNAPVYAKALEAAAAGGEDAARSYVAGFASAPEGELDAFLVGFIGRVYHDRRDRLPRLCR